MRRARWLILAAILVIITAVGFIYYGRLKANAKDLPPPARKLPKGIEGTAEGWHIRNSNGACPTYEVKAKGFKQIKEPSTMELEGVDLQLFHNCGTTYDHIVSAKAQFDTATGEMFSEGAVEITRGVPADAEPSPRLLKIESSGVRFETKSGKATTDKPSHFTFQNGDGKSVGAEYDPNSGELQLKSAVELNIQPKKPGALPARIESGFVSYREKEAKVLLSPSAKLTRGTLTLNTGAAVATIDKDVLKQVDAVSAWGVQDDPGRKVEYQADQMTITMNEDGQINKIVAERNAHLVSTSVTTRTDVKADRLDLEFAATDRESVLTKALATGHGVVDSNPVVKAGAPAADNRVLKSEFIELRMRAGGKEIENVETAAGSLEFIPNRPGLPRRLLTGEKMWIAYGPDNEIRNFRSVNVTTRTERPPKDGKPVPAAVTSSKNLSADFDPKTHQLAKLEQSADFKYQEGERSARADKAVLDQPTDQMTLTGGARVNDPSGSAIADQIVINQKTGDFKADGHVSSTRLPDKKPKASSAMLNNSEPLLAKANRMTSADNNLQIHYEGNAVAWQGANRVQADRLDIDRDEEVMKATGNVVSQFVDKAKTGKDGKPLAKAAAATFTVVRAPEMTYTEESRTAVYKGGVVMNRPSMIVKSRELTAFLKDQDADSSLEKALAEGDVSIVQTAPGRTRTGTSEHAEYYADEDKIILEKGKPKFVDTLKGTTEGEKLTYFSEEDRLLVNGAEREPAKTVLRKRKK